MYARAAGLNSRYKKHAIADQVPASPALFLYSAAAKIWRRNDSVGKSRVVSARVLRSL